MKCHNKLMVFFLFMLFGYGVDAFSYTYTFANMTDRDVKVRLHYAFGELTDRNEPISSYATHKFSFEGWEVGLCLTKIIVSSFDEKIGKWIELPAPMKMIDRNSFDHTQDAIRKFDEAVGEIGKSAALAGPSGKLITTAIKGLAQLVDASTEIWAVSLCRSRDFIFVLDHDQTIRMDRIYALTPPE